jgi:Transposase DDE domain group 1
MGIDVFDHLRIGRSSYAASAPPRTPASLPLASFAVNRIWRAVVALAIEITAWMPTLAFTEHEASRRWEPEKLRHRIFRIPAALACGGRRVWLHLSDLSTRATLTLTGLGRLADLVPS